MPPILNDIHIRTQLQPGDIGAITQLHGRLYQAEYGYGLSFEAYVAQGLALFYQQFDAAKDRVWICEYKAEIVGSLVLMHTESGAAQLRYFLIAPSCRGIGVGKKLMARYMESLPARGYTASFLWTTSDLACAAGLYRRYGFVLTAEKPSNAFGRPVLEQRYDWQGPGHLG